MKVFRVVTQRDGISTKEEGKSTTEIIEESFMYAASTIEDVWKEILWLRLDEEVTVVSIAEVAPAISIIKSPKE